MPTLRQLRRDAARSLSDVGLTFDDYVEWVQSGDVMFPIGGPQAIVDLLGTRYIGEISDDFAGHTSILKSNATVFACMLLRQMIFSEISFRFQRLSNGKPGTLFGTPALSLLEQPWPGATTGELASRMIQDTDLGGNFYGVFRNGRIYRRQPHKTSLVLSGDPREEEFVDVVGYLYQPRGDGGPAYTYLPEEMCHWAPIPDPLAEYRGMSWLTPVIREVMSDNAATEHKLAFFRNGATPTVIVKFPPDVMDEDSFDRFKAKMTRDYSGVRNGGKTLYLAPGADATVVGSSLQDLDLGNSQGRDETRIAAAAGIPPVILGQKESLGGSSLNQGNFASSRRRMSDGTFRPLYRSAAAALATLVPAPQDKGASRLWYDDSSIAFFREDRADAATIQQTKSATILSLVQSGYTPDSVVAAVDAEDMTLLQHSGLFSVQLQAPGAGQADANTPSSTPGAKK